jgi:hypothetical protein
LKIEIGKYPGKNNVKTLESQAIKGGRVKLTKMGREKISKYLLNEI